MSNQQKLVDMLIVPSIAGATAAGVAYFGMGKRGSVPFYRTSINRTLGILGAVTASSLIGETLKNYVLPYLPENENYAQLEAALINPVLSGVVTTAAFKLAAMSPVDSYFQAEPSYLRAFALGAGSEMFARYSYDNLISQYIPK